MENRRRQKGYFKLLFKIELVISHTYKINRKPQIPPKQGPGGYLWFWTTSSGTVFYPIINLYWTRIGDM